MTTDEHALTDSPGRTSLALIHELWNQRKHACPYLRHDEHGCLCTSPAMPASGDPYMPCDVYSVQLWCLTEDHYTKCCLWPAERVMK
jgi:hypothetical protein